MIAITLITILIPLTLLVTFFIGIAKKNKRLWITSLVFFIIILLLEIAYFTFSTVEKS